MRTLALSIFILTSMKLFAQDTPLLSESDLLSKKDLKKNAGWYKVRLDPHFLQTDIDASSVYEYYNFHRSNWNFPYLLNKAKEFNVVYKKMDPADSSKLLNGTVDIYDKKDHLIARDIFKNGFMLKEWDCYSWGHFKKHPGKLNYVMEYMPTKEQEEFILNAYDEHERFTQYSHQTVSKKEVTWAWDNVILKKTLYITDTWYKSGRDFWNYYIRTDSSSEGGKTSILIKSLEKETRGFAALTQDCSPGKYLGKRVRMTGYIRTENVTGWCGLWFRVDQTNSDAPLSFDNMENRKITGTSNWMKYEIVLNVPENASMLAFGALLSGNGKVWVDNISFEVVDVSVPITARITNNEKALNEEPMNLNFEK
jgi:hypothetical protein